MIRVSLIINVKLFRENVCKSVPRPRSSFYSDGVRRSKCIPYRTTTPNPRVVKFSLTATLNEAKVAVRSFCWDCSYVMSNPIKYLFEDTEKGACFMSHKLHLLKVSLTVTKSVS